MIRFALFWKISEKYRLTLNQGNFVVDYIVLDRLNRCRLHVRCFVYIDQLVIAARQLNVDDRSQIIKMTLGATAKIPQYHRRYIITARTRPPLLPFFNHFGHLFDNYLYIFDKTEVQMVILRC